MNTQLTTDLLTEKFVVRTPTAVASAIAGVLLALSALHPTPGHAGAARPAAGPSQQVRLVHTIPSSRLGSRLILGARQNVAGQTVTSWARENADRTLAAVGVTVPLGLIQNPPAKPGKGPLGAVAVLRFPAAVRQSTYFDHLEMHWNPNGHEPACCFGVPHFDMHFYGVPTQEVWTIKTTDPAPPSAERIPAGYIYPGAKESVPQMGVHAVLPDQVAPGHVMTADMLAGFWNGKMHFIEPMITRKWLLRKKSFTLAVPRPKELGRRTLYPTKFVARYDGKAQAYQLIFSGFQEMN